ncbi:MAG TPA: YIP1 family protein [bacterium]|nr:YIP1 family protein [bacterium]HQO36866.1 YIP1 family protein [bacterium]
MNEPNDSWIRSGEPICCTCGVPIGTREVPRLEGEPCCQRCLAGFAASVRRAGMENSTQSSNLIPWLRREELGFFRAFMQTVSDAMSQPTRFFGRLPTVSPPWAPLLFAVVCAFLFYFPGLLINETLLLPLVTQELQRVETNGEAAQPFDAVYEKMALYFSDRSPSRWMTLLIKFLIVEIILASWIQQIFVYLAGGRRGFEVTLQVRCYSLVGILFLLIPFVGMFIGYICWIGMNALGLREVHGISGWLSVLAAISPLLVALLLFLAAMSSGGAVPA